MFVRMVYIKFKNKLFVVRVIIKFMIVFINIMFFWFRFSMLFFFVIVLFSVISNNGVFVCIVVCIILFIRFRFM